ncbi:chondroitin AC/alginate lyase [Stachybotrys elegans]|uniref:Chondroitin AC/alginate lyase n=1 Tax=Stachybotrys elegans TaxID=80388 RepID=A0A8K0SI35_9HYPO|nr:chondroitin AC/alginate lyase [Stachybotrys elegans]
MPHCTVNHAHPRLFSTLERWQDLDELIAVDDYLGSWNKTVFEKAEAWYSLPSVKYVSDGPLYASGVLDVAREFQQRIKHWCYAFRISKDSKWKKRVWAELQVASGNTTQYFGEPHDIWNTQHWLDTGEFLVAFSIAYDWLYHSWDSHEKDAIMWTMINMGLKKGQQAYEEDQWFLHAKGNWNCVVNGGLIIGALAIYHEDPTGTASRILTMAIENARGNCCQGASPDGTWLETPDYWYFGTQAHAQLSSALLSATGDTQGMLSQDTVFTNTSLFHIYNQGMTEKFNWGDCGPKKFTATANSLLFYGEQYQASLFTLYQRDQPDAHDPLAILWYSAVSQSDWSRDLALDKNFPSPRSAWVSMRSTWSDDKGLFLGMKAGSLRDHSTHGNLDVGDFVLDALGERWASELCHEDYLAPGYFNEGESPDSTRWFYYRCRTEGQNTLLFNGSNQESPDEPSTSFQSTEYADLDPDTKESSAFWTVDLGSVYGKHENITRGVRFIQNRQQVIIQDDILGSLFPSQLRMHTEATINILDGGTKARLQRNGQTLDVFLDSPPGLSFSTMEAVRSETAPALPQGVVDSENTGFTVLTINIPAGSHAVVVRFAPVWSSVWVAKIPDVVPISGWTLSSHNQK